MSTYQENLFLPTICNPCLLKDKPVTTVGLSICLGCKLIRYCSPEHQKLDWKIHKPFCRAVKTILDIHKVDHLMYINGPIKTKDELYYAVLRVKYMLRILLKRSLEHHEEELTSFPVICAICYTAQMSTLYQCKECKAVSYCCKEHEEEHLEVHQYECLKLKAYYCKFKTCIETVDKISLQQSCDIISFNLTYAMRNMFDIEFAEDPCEDVKDFSNFSFVGGFSCIATIVYVLSHLDMNCFGGVQFTICVAGTTNDYLWFSQNHLEFFFACYPAIKLLNIVFLGPELIPKKPRILKFIMDGGRMVMQSLHKRTLEDYLKGKDDRLRPNLICCFNCGFSEMKFSKTKDDLWYKGLRFMLELPEVPIVFTSYTDIEADFDYGRLMSVVDERKETIFVELEDIIKKHLNPYRDIRPLRNLTFNDEDNIFYRNGFIQAVRIRFSA